MNNPCTCHFTGTPGPWHLVGCPVNELLCACCYLAPADPEDVDGLCLDCGVECAPLGEGEGK